MMDVLLIVALAVLAIPIAAGAGVALMFYVVVGMHGWRAARKGAVRLYASTFVAIAGQWIPE